MNWKMNKNPINPRSLTQEQQERKKKWRGVLGAVP